jgi:Holliday junction resolvase
VNNKAKGTRREHAARRILELAGYTVIRAAGSHGLFDLVAVGPRDCRLVQVKCNGYLSGVEREQLQLLVVPDNVVKECWRFVDRCRTPIVERF